MNTKEFLLLQKIIMNDVYKLEDIDGIDAIRKQLGEMQEEYQNLSDEVLQEVYEYYSEEPPYLNFLYKNLRKVIDELPQEERAEGVFELLRNNIGLDMQSILKEEDKYLILDKINAIDPEQRNLFLSYICTEEDVLNYINIDGTNKEILLDEMIKIYGSNTNRLIGFCRYLKDDYIKAEVCISCNIHDKNILAGITDDYIRSRIILNANDTVNSNQKNKQRYLDSLKEYKQMKERLEEIDDESKKAELICSIKENDMKIQFLKGIKENENRDKIIKSLEGSISPEIESANNLVQKMITEFFEDSLGEDFSKDKREKMEMVFRRSTISYKKIENVNTSAITYNCNDIVNVNIRLRGNNARVIQNLTHEYGHLFSNFSSKETEYFSAGSEAIEEGTQDLFSEMVINHYLEKHGKIELDGKKVRIDYPFTSFSSYDKENAWQRTIMYALEKKGEDKLALAEYQLGDKSKYLEMALGQEIAEQKPRDSFGNPIINTSVAEIYYAHPEEFKEINRESIYYRRNWILPEYELQNKLDGKDIDLINHPKGRYYCKYIASEYFEHKKLYEIEPEDLQEFVELVEATREDCICEYDNYANEITSKFNEQELEEHSFEILENSAIIWHNMSSAGVNIEIPLGKCLEKETEKVDEGQDVSTSLKKYKAIIPKYKALLSKNLKTASNVYLLDRVKDLQYAYLDQLDQALDEDREGTINAITETGDSEIWLDKDISEVLGNHEIVLESMPKRQSSYSTDDVIKIAIKGKFTLGEIEGLGIAVESTKERESIKNYEARL